MAARYRACIRSRSWLLGLKTPWFEIPASVATTSEESGLGNLLPNLFKSPHYGDALDPPFVTGLAKKIPDRLMERRERHLPGENPDRRDQRSNVPCNWKTERPT